MGTQDSQEKVLKTMPARDVRGLVTQDNVEYSIDEQTIVAQGGMAVIRRGECIINGQHIPAIFKEARPNWNNPSSSEYAAVEHKLRNEARFLSALTYSCQNTEHFPRYLGYFTSHSGVSYLAMEVINGDTLDNDLKDGKALKLFDAVVYAYQIAQALVWCHLATNEEGKPNPIFHKDVTPKNIMITRGSYHATLIDFGASFSEGISTGATMPFVTHTHAAPVSVTGAAEDIWQLGVTLFVMVTGVYPFDKSPYSEDRLDYEDLNYDALIEANIPTELINVILKALESSRRYQYKSMADFRDDLGNVLKSLPMDPDFAAWMNSEQSQVPICLQKLFPDNITRPEKTRPVGSKTRPVGA